MQLYLKKLISIHSFIFTKLYRKLTHWFLWKSERVTWLWEIMSTSIFLLTCFDGCSLMTVYCERDYNLLFIRQQTREIVFGRNKSSTIKSILNQRLAINYVWSNSIFHKGKCEQLHWSKILYWRTHDLLILQPRAMVSLNCVHKRLLC